MSNLIKALQIFLKYGDDKWPTNCSHDTLAVCGYEKSAISDEDLKELDSLGFFWADEHECFISYRFGSC